MPIAEQIAAFFLVFSLAGHGDADQKSSRLVQKFKMPHSRATVVVAEGEFEPRSVGSYVLNVYGGSSRRSPTDEFIAGIVRRRNGTVENVMFEDVTRDGIPDIVVIIRSAGSGGYLSTDAFRYQNRSLEFLGTVSGLDKGADPVEALRDRLKTSNREK